MLAIGRVGRTVLPDFLGVILTHDACCHNTPKSSPLTKSSQVNHTTSQVQTVQFLRGEPEDAKFCQLLISGRKEAIGPQLLISSGTPVSYE